MPSCQIGLGDLAEIRVEGGSTQVEEAPVGIDEVFVLAVGFVDLVEQTASEVGDPVLELLDRYLESLDLRLGVAEELRAEVSNFIGFSEMEGAVCLSL